MATIPAPRARGASGSLAARLKENPAYQAFWLLRTGFTVAPVLFGLDKFSHLLVNWDRYLAPRIDNLLPGTAHQAMYAVGQRLAKPWPAMFGADQHRPCERPPSTGRSVPVTYDALLEQRNATTSPTSWGWPKRPAGIAASSSGGASPP